MTVGDGIAIGMTCWATAAVIWAVAWQKVRLSAVHLDAAKAGFEQDRS